MPRLWGAHSGAHFVAYRDRRWKNGGILGWLSPTRISNSRATLLDFAQPTSQPASFVCISRSCNRIRDPIWTLIRYDARGEARLAPMQICHLPSRPPRDIFEDCNAPQISHRGRDFLLRLGHSPNSILRLGHSPNSLLSPISPLQLKRSPKFSPIL